MSEFSGQSGQTLTKLPGSIEGESFVIKNLEKCSVFILDYTSEVEVANCTDCQIFIGPVDGPAIFDSCKDCQVAVACQQFQAKNCDNIEFGLYCATQPSINTSKNIRFGCWMGAYPGLTGHFKSANLDPKTNTWDKVYDAAEGDQPNFELIDNAHYWEVPIQGEGSLENPVPSADGKMYSPSPAPVANGGMAPPMENGNTPHAPSAAKPVELEAEPPQVRAMLTRMRERLAKQETTEQKTKVELQQKAESYLNNFYSGRTKQKESSAKRNRDAEKTLAVKGPDGDTPWEKTINSINFSFKSPTGTDLTRFKNLLFAAKAKNVPVK